MMISSPPGLRATRSFLRSVALQAVLMSFAVANAQTVPSGFSDGLVMGGWNEPVGFTSSSATRVYVWEKRGVVWIIDNGTRLASPLIDISEEVGGWRDHGLLGFALDPNFQSNGHIYLMYTVDRHHLMNFGTGSYNATTDQFFAATIMRITRYTATLPALTTVNPATRLVLVGETKETGAAMLHESHSTGQLVFGTDGTLLATMGDAASYNNVDVGNDAGTYYAQALTDGIIRPAENVGAMRSQLVNCHNGKVLRIDPATGNGVPSNPYYDASAPRAPKSRVWAMGLRNPYRMTLRPNSGSTDPAAGDPGTLYIGDVGWNGWEELNVCYEAGMNFGWPLFEGMEPNTGYTATTVYNLDAPNPLYGGACTQAYFQFKDLLKQDTPIPLNGHPNPCDAAQQIPPSVLKFHHARPAIDWAHGNQSRSPGFSGSAAITYDLDAVGAPVPGPRFGGYASVGGTWITGTGWPAGYQNVYFNADYAGSWIRRFQFAPNDLPTSVHDFGSNMGAVVFLKEGPDGCLWYVRYETNELRKVCPLGVSNLSPVAVIGQNAHYGPGPLTVQFTGTGSSDPENGALTYAWDFGNGQTSTAANPSMTFTAPPATPTTYTVTLTVTDPQGSSSTTTTIVSVNNTPPSVAITSFPDGHYYPIGVDSTYALEASVTDLEHTPQQLTYAWQTILHHNTHIHPEAIDPNPVSSTVITGVGCDGQTYSYEVKLKVTDAGGLSTTVANWLYPRCYAVAPTAVILSDKTAGTGPLTVNFNGSSSSDPGGIVSYAWDFGDGTSAVGPTPTKVFTDAGAHNVTLVVTDGDGLTGMAVKVITVVALDPPQCLGQSGSITRQYWNGIAGNNVADLVNSPNYPNSPSGVNYPSSFSRQSLADGNNFGARFRGYILAPTTGNYTFTAVSDDASEVYLSLNAEAGLKQLICTVPGAVGQGSFTNYPSQTSASIPLVAGKYYYVEMLHKEGSGQDHAALYWQTPTNSTRTIIPGSALARYIDCAPSVTLRANLQGPFRTANNLMQDSLRTKGLIPANEPFTALGFARAGGSGETVSPATLAVTGSNAIVDWVLVELRNKNTPSQLVATKAALLQRDGDIVGTDGYRRILFSVAADNYYVAVRHRNHLGVMSATSQALGNSERYIDFTLGATATYGTDARKQLSGDRWGLWTGNAYRDNKLMYTGANNDRDVMLTIIGGVVPTNTFTGYSPGDANLDGLVKYTGLLNDRDLVLQNIGGLIPTTIRQEQLP